MTQRRRYSAEFKREAVALTRQPGAKIDQTPLIDTSNLRMCGCRLYPLFKRHWVLQR